MFGFFKKKSKTAKLYKKHQILMEEAYRLSHIDRKASAFKTAEAEAVMQQIEKLEQARS